MLQITVPASELYDEVSETFIETKETVLRLEHSLLSISKWESKWCKPFLATDKSDKKTPIEMLDYIKCMTLNNNVSENVYNALTLENIKKINDYIDHPMTATTITDRRPGGKKEIITSELIYYFMISYNIPFECEKWHLNRLLMLIKVCSIKNDTSKMNRSDLMKYNRSLNAKRRKALRSKG